MVAATDEKWGLYLELAKSSDKLDQQTIDTVIKKYEGAALSSEESELFTAFERWADRYHLWEAYCQLIAYHNIDSTVENVVMKVHQLEKVSPIELEIFKNFEEWATQHIAH